MKKTLKFQILTFITVLMLLMPMTVMASSAIEPGIGATLNQVVAKMGDKEYATLEELAAEFGDKVSYEDNKMILVEDLELTNTLYIGQADADKVTLVIDLNGHNITAPRRVISVQNADLTVMGDGMVQETDPYYAAIAVYGSTDSSAKDYSVVTVAESVELEGYYGIMVSQNSTNTAYGVVVNCDAKITAKSDATSTGSGLYVNGYIQHITNAPVFNVGAAEINASGCGIYAAGYAEWNLDGTKLTGVENAFGIKAGKFNIKNVTAKVTGEDLTPVEGYNNGINPSGAVFQLESNTGYPAGIYVNIENGNFTSEKGYGIYEYVTKAGTNTYVKEFVVNGGTFNSAKEVIAVSESFDKNITKFVKGGIFSSNKAVKYVKDENSTALNKVSADLGDFVADGYICQETDNGFKVLKESSIVVTTPVNGTIKLPADVTANNDKVVAGEIVKLTISPKDGYEFSKVVVKDASGAEITVNENNEFVMPNSNVTVEAVFTKIPETVTGTDAPVVDLNKEVEEPVVGVTNSDKVEDILLESLEANEELAKKAENKTTTVAVVVKDIVLTDQDKEDIKKALGDKGADVKISKFFDISVELKDKADNATLGNISELKSELEFVIALPTELQGAPEGFDRVFFVVREHNGEIKALETTLAEDGKSVSFSSNLFSNYALAYVDVPVVADDDKDDDANKNEGTVDDKDDVNKEDGTVDDKDDTSKDESNKEENSDVPTTGDVVLPVSIALVVVSLAGIAFFVVKNRKIKK